MCTTTRAKKLIISQALVSVAVGCIFTNQDHLRRYYITRVITDVVYVAFFVVVPMTVLIVNAILIREVRRAANNAAANLGLQQHHQSTSSNSAVPTVMLITISLVYVLLHGPPSILWVAYRVTEYYSFAIYHVILGDVSCIVYAYNFYVYIITGKQFRSELRALFGCSSFSSSSSSAAAAVVVVVYDRNDARLAGRGQAKTAV